MWSGLFRESAALEVIEVEEGFGQDADMSGGEEDENPMSNNENKVVMLGGLEKAEKKEKKVSYKVCDMSAAHSRRVHRDERIRV